MLSLLDVPERNLLLRNHASYRTADRIELDEDLSTVLSNQNRCAQKTFGNFVAAVSELFFFFQLVMFATSQLSAVNVSCLNWGNNVCKIIQTN